MVSEQTKKKQITPKVKERVWERDNHRCIYCGSPEAAPEAHFIARSQGGLGVEENILTLCRRCHERYDKTLKRPEMHEFFKSYLQEIYSDWNEKELIYHKGM